MISFKTFPSPLVALTLLLTLAFGATAHGETEQGGPPAGRGADDIVTVAQQAGHYTTFLKLLDKAEMTERLRGKGPYTVFMPNDDAFAQLAEQDRSRLFNLQGVPLRRYMNYQIVGGLVPTTEMRDAQRIQGLYQQVEITRQGDGIKVNDARIVEPDLKANNGIIHGLDHVIEPFFE